MHAGGQLERRADRRARRGGPHDAGDFIPRAEIGQRVEQGDLLGIVQETERIEHRVLVPPGVGGIIRKIAPAAVGVEEPIARLDTGAHLTLLSRWPVRTPRPFRERLSPTIPFFTGQRVFDMVFPVPLGGSAVVPGGFGTGKTVAEQSLARHARAEIIIYIGCGERGNEMTDVLSEFPRLTDPHTGRPLMERTILVINTSNMPVAAREASIFTGITLGEYYRDMGYDVAIMADSTSRWAEALREISSRLEEMPGEEGYPTYLATRLSQYYERGGRVRCLGGDERIGSVTIVGAVSPPGGDFSEPVTQTSMRIAGALWALDADLAHQRHFPAINWQQSYSLYTELINPWYREQVADDWPELRARMMELLQREEELMDVVQLVGVDALQDEQRAILEASRLVREAYLRQSAYSEMDASCPVEKQYWMLKALLKFQDLVESRVRKGVGIEKILKHPMVHELASMKESESEGFESKARDMIARMEQEMSRPGPEGK